MVNVVSLGSIVLPSLAVALEVIASLIIIEQGVGSLLNYYFS